MVQLGEMRAMGSPQELAPRWGMISSPAPSTSREMRSPAVVPPHHVMSGCRISAEPSRTSTSKPCSVYSCSPHATRVHPGPPPPMRRTSSA